jgi:geranylgeranyl pyrophosphate synthase
MNFKEYVELHRAMIYSTICEYVPLKEPVEHHSIMRDYIDRKGNYRRPGLVLLAGQLFGAKPEELMLPAAAQQLSEDWILMQDDAEDDSELRRGKPAAHRIYGWVHTINATNTGQMAMWKMLKEHMIKVGNEKGNKVYEKFYDMLAYTVEGQYIENKFIHNTKDLSQASEELYYRILESKTCYYTVYGPMQIGAIAAGQSGEVLDILKEMGKNAGIAFQIQDDILDMTADEKLFGKKNFGDLYEGKLTLMVLHAYKNATADEKKKFDDIYRKKRQDKTKDEIDFIREMIDKYHGLDYAKETAKRYGEKAAEVVAKYKDRLPQNEYADILLSAMKEMYERNK